jgi:hypothetical protein
VVPSGGSSEPCAPKYATGDVPPVEVTRTAGRPAVASVVREGDPAGAVSVVVRTSSGSLASSAISALLEARLRTAGWTAIEARADRDSARIGALVEGADQGSRFVTAVRTALAKPVSQAGPEVELAQRRWANLRSRALEAPILASIANCTGSIGLLTSEVTPDATAARLEEDRRAAFGGALVAFGAVGPVALTKSVAGAVRDGEAWPSASVDDTVAAPEERVGAFSSAGATSASARLMVALVTERAESALAAAEQVGEPNGALAARLRALPSPFRLVETTAVVRGRGGCVAVAAESIRPIGASIKAEDAAAAAEVALEEMGRARERRDEGSGSDGALPFRAARAVRAVGDPREAADLAARWALSKPASPDEAAAPVIALSLPGSNGSREAASAAMQATSARLNDALAKLRDGKKRRSIDRRERVERGQGELWMLLGSTCGTSAENAGDAGSSALGLATAIATQPAEPSGVALESWVTPDGLGVIAHAAPAPGESNAVLATRVAERAARTFSAPLTSPAFASARGVLLARLAEGSAPDGHAQDAAVAAVAPGHPSWLLPLGSWDTVSKAGLEAVSVRWADLVGGPLRVAVIANDSSAQVEAAGAAVDRWLARADEASRRCPASEDAVRPKPATVALSTASNGSSQALLALPVAGSGPQRVFAELLQAGLVGEGGWLDKALASLNATTQVRLWGGARAAALVIDARGAEANLDATIAQLRALLQRLGQGAIAAPDLARAVALRERARREALLDPRRRLVDLWREPSDPSKPDEPTAEANTAWLEAWRGWAANNLQDERLVIVSSKPKH